MINKTVPQDTVIREWIRAEQDSARFKHYYTHSDLLDETMHPEERLEKLAKLRKGFPARFPWHFVQWRQYTIESKEQLGKVRTHKGINWLALSKGTRFIKTAAEVIASQNVKLDPHLHINGIIKSIESGAELPKMIGFLPTENFDTPVLLEGHARTVAYYLCGKTRFPITLYVATTYTDRLVTWDNGLSLQEIRHNFLRYGKEQA